jgi:hypothetical protein
VLKNFGTSLQHGAQLGFLAMLLALPFTMSNPKVVNPGFEQIKILLSVTLLATLCEFLVRNFNSQLRKE